MLTPTSTVAHGRSRRRAIGRMRYRSGPRAGSSVIPSTRVSPRDICVSVPSCWGAGILWTRPWSRWRTRISWTAGIKSVSTSTNATPSGSIEAFPLSNIVNVSVSRFVYRLPVLSCFCGFLDLNLIFVRVSTDCESSWTLTNLLLYQLKLFRL